MHAEDAAVRHDVQARRAASVCVSLPFAYEAPTLAYCLPVRGLSRAVVQALATLFTCRHVRRGSGNYCREYAGILLRLGCETLELPGPLGT